MTPMKVIIATTIIFAVVLAALCTGCAPGQLPAVQVTITPGK